jgi:threonine dehydratase
VVILVTGGNIDINLLDRIIAHGLAKAGRTVRLALDIRDRPGELAKLLTLVGATGANVRTIEHGRMRRDIPIGWSRVTLELETRGPEHVASVLRELREHGYQAAINGG